MPKQIRQCYEHVDNSQREAGKWKQQSRYYRFNDDEKMCGRKRVYIIRFISREHFNCSSDQDQDLSWQLVRWVLCKTRLVSLQIYCPISQCVSYGFVNLICKCKGPQTWDVSCDFNSKPIFLMRWTRGASSVCTLSALINALFLSTFQSSRFQLKFCTIIEQKHH